MAEWWSIEVFHADLSARRWKDSYEGALIEAALGERGPGLGRGHEHRTGVVLEVQFRDGLAVGGVPRAARPCAAALDAGAGPGERAHHLPRPRWLLRFPLAPAARPQAKRGGDELAEPAEQWQVDDTEAGPPDWGSRGPPGAAGSDPGAGARVAFCVVLASDCDLLPARGCPSGANPPPGTGQDGTMRDTRVSADDLRAAIERTGYYPDWLPMPSGHRSAPSPSRSLWFGTMRSSIRAWRCAGTSRCWR